MNKIPFQVCDITNPQELFGREQLLKRLVVAANLKQNTNIIGARRFGKTCVLKTACTLLRQTDNISVYPVFIDVKSADIKGTDAVYRYLLGVLIESLFADGIFTEQAEFGNVDIMPCDDWTIIDEQLRNLTSSRIQSVFQRVVYFMSELMDKTILFMIDEYEYLFKYALDSGAGFMKLRTMSSDTLQNGLRPFCFWLTGATPWDQLRNEVVGSGEANTVSGSEYVTPISKDEFIRMWESECALIDDEEKQTILLESVNYAYDKSGGVPDYGKNVIGTFILKNGVLPDYTICLGSLQELSNKALNSGEYKILKDLAIAPKKIATSNTYVNLRNKGLICVRTKDISFIPIGFLNDFILGELADQKVKVQPLPESYTIMESITDKIELINKQRLNHKKTAIFPPTYDNTSLENDLRTPCHTKEQLSDFASALYRYYYERLKVSKNEFGAFLYGSFGKCVDTARHSIGGGHEMDLFEKSDGQYSYADMLMEIMGSANELSSSQEYYKFQIEMLKRFKETVDKLFVVVKKV